MSALPPGVLREASIDVGAITHNTRHIAAAVGVPIIAVVKADAYGHGAVRTARAALAGGAQMLGVTDLGEAFELRDAGIDAPILSWLHAPGTDFRAGLAQDITIGVSSLEQLRAVAAARVAERPASVHLKFETGLSRNGIAPADRSAVLAETARFVASGDIVLDGVFSHLSNTTDIDDLAALARFEDAVAETSAAGLHPRWRHMAATGAALTLPATRLDAVRIGIGLHGLSPLEGRSSADLGLRPSMTVRGQIAAVRQVPAGTGVSYGYRYRTDHATTLALVPLGYADGVPRAASGRGPVRIGDTMHAVAGTIAMDQFVVDVGDAPVAVGDEVVLFGDPDRGDPTAEDWAAAADTINYEIVTRIGSRVPRREVHS
ncbi:alanine racemase [Microbacterium gorillae]|uniref:alanine racemase n=1 Tax=Microbacterium gorillae TaxID=1231063 RepID=UPI00059106E3|nr:alanine racemase [Microbacterium gorillae]